MLARIAQIYLYQGGNFKMAWYAITSNGIGELVSYRAIRENFPLFENEWKTQIDPRGKVLAEDGRTLRAQTDADRLPKIKAERAAYINALRDRKLAEPVEYGGNTYDADDRSIANLNRAVNFINAAPPGAPIPAQIPWRDAGNTTRQLTPRQLWELGGEIFTRTNTIYATSWTLKDAIEAATTPAEVNAIDWP